MASTTSPPPSSSSSSSCKNSYTPLSIIEIKRDNTRPHTHDEIEWFVTSYTCASNDKHHSNNENNNNATTKVESYQMSAWLMSIYLNGMTRDETASLTDVMTHSGLMLDLSDVKEAKKKESNKETTIMAVDKHSTGGVGDKVSFILAPLVASVVRDAPLIVPMMAGRGLEHTGGTIDKLESIPGYRASLSVTEVKDVLASEVGCVIMSPGMDICPADRKIYALRDVTGTVASVPLQTASIMCKKIAEGIDGLVLDVKCGRAAFQKNTESAITLAQSMIRTGERCGLKTTTAYITRMDHPIGYAVGNWLEVKECIGIMKHGTQASTWARDLVSLVLVEAAQMLIQGGVVASNKMEDAIRMAQTHLDSGKVYERFRDMVQAQGGDLTFIDSPEDYPKAKHVANVVSPTTGYVSDVDALSIGKTAILIGAGRKVSDQTVDAAAGIRFNVKVGDHVKEGDILATVHTECDDVDTLRDATERIRLAISFSSEKVALPPLISHFVTKDGVEEFSMDVIDSLFACRN